MCQRRWTQFWLDWAAVEEKHMSLLGRQHMMRDGLEEVELLLLDSDRRIGYHLQTDDIVRNVWKKWELCLQCSWWTTLDQGQSPGEYLMQVVLEGLTWLRGKHLCTIHQVGKDPCQWLFCDRKSRLKYWQPSGVSDSVKCHLKSRSIRATTWLRSIAQTISLWTNSTADSVEWNWW